MKHLRVKILFFFTLVLIEIIIGYRAVLVLDPDLGIHMAMGKYIISSGIPKTDPFSYTMPSFPYTDHEWFSQILAFKLYGFLGIEGLAVISTLITILALIIAIPKPIKPFSFILLILSSGGLISFSGVRPQVITWLFIALLVRVGTIDALWQRYRLLIPLLMLVWVNLHGGFAAGLVVLILIASVQTLRHTAQWFPNLLTVILSALATTINPYGFRIWDEVILTITDSYLRETINEWGPIFINFNLITRLSLIIYFFISLSLVLRYILKLSLIESSLFLSWLVLAFTSRRHIPIWLIVSLPAAYHSFELLTKESWFNHSWFRFVRAGSIIWLILLLISFSSFIYQSREVVQASYRVMEDFLYPVHAVTFLHHYPMEGNLFSPYGWGGYLLWKLPEKKLFIDGRMPSWRWQSPDSSQSDWAFKEYTEASSGHTNFDATFEKYNVTTILWPTNYFQRGLGTNTPIDKISVSSTNLPYDAFLARLIRQGWKRVYADPVAVIYTKPN